MVRRGRSCLRRAGAAPARPAPARPVRSASARLAALAAVPAALLLCAAAASPAAGQAAGGPADTVGAADTAAVLPEPEMAEAPDAFRVSASGGVLSWPDDPGLPRLSDAGLWGLDVESRVSRFVAFRLSGAYGSATASGTPSADTIPGTTDVSQFVVDVAAELRAAFGPLDRAGVVPFGTAGLGTVVHDPSASELGTKSQSAWSWGAGVEVEALPGSLGARGEWRRYRVDAEDLFNPLDRTGRMRSADRLFVTLYWSL